MKTQNRIKQVESRIGQLQKIFECPICLELMKNPVSTKCDHMFCRHCMLETIAKKTVAPCPLCKETVTKRSLQNLPKWNQIVTNVQKLATAFQQDTGLEFCPSTHLTDTINEAGGSSPLCLDTADVVGATIQPSVQEKLPDIEDKCVTTTNHPKQICSKKVKSKNRRNTRQAKKRTTDGASDNIYIKDAESGETHTNSFKTHINISSGFPSRMTSKKEKNTECPGTEDPVIDKVQPDSDTDTETLDVSPSQMVYAEINLEIQPEEIRKQFSEDHRSPKVLTEIGHTEDNCELSTADKDPARQNNLIIRTHDTGMPVLEPITSPTRKTSQVKMPSQETIPELIKEINVNKNISPKDKTCLKRGEEAGESNPLLQKRVCLREVNRYDTVEHEKELSPESIHALDIDIGTRIDASNFETTNGRKTRQCKKRVTHQNRMKDSVSDNTTSTRTTRRTNRRKKIVQEENLDDEGVSDAVKENHLLNGQNEITRKNTTASDKQLRPRATRSMVKRGQLQSCANSKNPDQGININEHQIEGAVTSLEKPSSSLSRLSPAAKGFDKGTTAESISTDGEFAQSSKTPVLGNKQFFSPDPLLLESCESEASKSRKSNVASVEKTSPCPQQDVQLSERKFSNSEANKDSLLSAPKSGDLFNTETEDEVRHTEGFQEESPVVRRSNRKTFSLDSIKGPDTQPHVSESLDFREAILEAAMLFPVADSLIDQEGIRLETQKKNRKRNLVSAHQETINSTSNNDMVENDPDSGLTKEQSYQGPPEMEQTLTKQLVEADDLRMGDYIISPSPEPANDSTKTASVISPTYQESNLIEMKPEVLSINIEKLNSGTDYIEGPTCDGQPQETSGEMNSALCSNDRTVDQNDQLETDPCPAADRLNVDSDLTTKSSVSAHQSSSEATVIDPTPEVLTGRKSRGKRKCTLRSKRVENPIKESSKKKKYGSDNSPSKTGSSVHREQNFNKSDFNSNDVSSRESDLTIDNFGEGSLNIVTNTNNNVEDIKVKSPVTRKRTRRRCHRKAPPVGENETIQTDTVELVSPTPPVKYNTTEPHQPQYDCNELDSAALTTTNLSDTKWVTNNTCENPNSLSVTGQNQSLTEESQSLLHPQIGYGIILDSRAAENRVSRVNPGDHDDVKEKQPVLQEKVISLSNADDLPDIDGDDEEHYEMRDNTEPHIPESITAVHSSATSDEDDMVDVAVRRRAKRLRIDSDDECKSEKTLNNTTSSNLSSQSEIISTQQKAHLENDVMYLQSKIAQLEAQLAETSVLQIEAEQPNIQLPHLDQSLQTIQTAELDSDPEDKYDSILPETVVIGKTHREQSEVEKIREFAQLIDGALNKDKRKSAQNSTNESSACRKVPDRDSVTTDCCHQTVNEGDLRTEPTYDSAIVIPDSQEADAATLENHPVRRDDDREGDNQSNLNLNRSISCDMPGSNICHGNETSSNLVTDKIQDANDDCVSEIEESDIDEDMEDDGEEDLFATPSEHLSEQLSGVSSLITPLSPSPPPDSVEANKNPVSNSSHVPLAVQDAVELLEHYKSVLDNRTGERVPSPIPSQTGPGVEHISHTSLNNQSIQHPSEQNSISESIPDMIPLRKTEVVSPRCTTSIPSETAKGKSPRVEDLQRKSPGVRLSSPLCRKFSKGNSNSENMGFPHKPYINIITSGISRSMHLPVVEQLAAKVGGRVLNKYIPTVTHLLVKPHMKPKRCQRTLKYFQAVSGKKWILNLEWALNSIKEGRLLAEEEYEIIGDNLEGNHYAPKRSRMSETDLLKNIEICCLGDFENITRDELKGLVEACGATTVQNPSMFSFDAGIEQIVLVEEREVHSLRDLLKKLQRTYQVPIVKKEWLLDCIGVYTQIELDGYLINDILGR